MAPVEALIVGVAPVIVAIFESSVPTVSVTLSWLTPAPLATKVSVVPSTLMVSPATKLVVSESLGDVPDRAVELVIGAGVAASFETAVPVIVASVYGSAGGPTGNGLYAKSEGVRPPASVLAHAAVVLLCTVAG